MRRAPVFLLAAIVAACTTPASDWWTFQHDLGHTGFVVGGMGPAPKPLWSIPLVAGTVSLTPPVFGAHRDTFRIFIGSGYGDNRIFALRPANGATMWTFTAAPNNGFFSAPVAADSGVYAATLGMAPHVYALRQNTGGVVWQTPLPVGTRASIAVGGGRVYVYSDDHKLRALSQATGAILWVASTTPTSVSQESSPAVGFGNVYVGSDSGLHAFNAITGAFQWMYPTNGHTGFSSPVVQMNTTTAPGLVLIGDNSGRLHAVNGATGTNVWTHTAGATLTGGSVAAAQGRVFVLDYGSVVALNVSSGAVLWNQPVPPVPRHSPAIARTVLFYHDNQSVYGLNTTTGAVGWNAPVPGNGNPSSPGAAMAIALEILLVPNKGHLHAFR